MPGPSSRESAGGRADWIGLLIRSPDLETLSCSSECSIWIFAYSYVWLMRASLLVIHSFFWLYCHDSWTYESCYVWWQSQQPVSLRAAESVLAGSQALQSPLLWPCFWYSQRFVLGSTLSFEAVLGTLIASSTFPSTRPRWYHTLPVPPWCSTNGSFSWAFWWGCSWLPCWLACVLLLCPRIWLGLGQPWLAAHHRAYCFSH